MDNTVVKNSEVDLRCRSALVKCDVFKHNTARSVFVGEGLKEYRNQVPDNGQTPELRVDQFLEAFRDKIWKGVPILALFLEELAGKMPEGDDLRKNLQDLARDVREIAISPTDQPSRSVPLSAVYLDIQAEEEYLRAFVVEYNRAPKWHTIENTSEVSFSDLIFILPDLTTWSNYAHM